MGATLLSRKQAGGVSVAPPRQRSLWTQIWRSRWQYVGISPFIILFVVFSLYPMLYTLRLSFHQLSASGEWIPTGFENYVAMVNHLPFQAALVNTVAYLVIGVPILVVGSLLGAVILNDPRLRLRGVYRTIIFLPYVTAEVVVAIVFFSIFDRYYGFLNGMLGLLGIESIPWLVSPDWSKLPVLVLFIWGLIGYYLILMLAGLQSIPQDLYEAASLDGASDVHKFFGITVPLMRGIILFVLVSTTIAVLNLFGAPFVLTGGGPQESSTTLTLLLYQTAFQWVNFGLASAIAVAITVIAMIVAMVQIRLVGLRSY